MSWVDAKDGEVPDGCLVAGYYNDQQEVFVSRAKHEDDMLPGKLIPSHHVCYVTNDARQYVYNDYQVLYGDYGSFMWVRSSNGLLEDGTVVGGHQGEAKLYVGRVLLKNNVLVGKINPEHGVLFGAHNGSEIFFHNYELLVCRPAGGNFVITNDYATGRFAYGDPIKILPKNTYGTYQYKCASSLSLKLT